MTPRAGSMRRENSRENKSAQERRREEASRWYVVLRYSDLTPGKLNAWKKWEAVQENREAYDDVLRLWGQPDAECSIPDPSEAERIADEYDGSLPVKAWLARGVDAPARSWRVAALLVAASAAVAFVALSWTGYSNFKGTRHDDAFVSAETGVAEHRDLRLADGSRIYLGAQTLVTVQFTPQARSIVLHRGEALFDVAHDRERPFRVNAGRGDITAVGTKFNVVRRDDHVVVTVAEGIVDVRPAGPSAVTTTTGLPHGQAQRFARLTKGEEIGFDPLGNFSQLRVTEASVAASWRDGRLTYRSETLRNVLQDVNRYARHQVIVGDTAAGDMLYSGTVFEHQIDDWIVALGRLYPELEIVRTADHVLIRTKASSTRDY